MSYPGNASLPPDVQGRIVETFEQTLTLAAQGKLQEARLGCDFVLRLDPSYAPAQELAGRLEGANGPIEVADLSPRAAPAAPPPDEIFDAIDEPVPETLLPPDDAFEPIDDLDLELPDLPLAQPTAATATAAAPPAELGSQLRQLLEQRDFTALTKLAEANGQAIMAEPQLRQLMQTAIERREAEPYVSNFLDSARMALQTGDAAEVEALLAKARQLDPSHPGIAEIEAAKAHYADPERVMGSRRTVAVPLLAAPPQTPAPAAVPPVKPPPGAAPTAAPPAAAPPSPAPAPTAAAEPPGALGLGGDTEALPSLLGDDGAAADGAEESDPRIKELLAEGQAAYERGELQTAIDAWSRIFLIDIDHQEASRRIEEARRRKAEQERRLEELYHDALSKAEGGDSEAAKALLGQVLQLAPNHLAAREALDQLEAGQALVPSRPPTSVAEESLLDLASPDGGVADDDFELKEEILVPPEPGAAPPPSLPSAPPQVGKARESRRTVLLAASAVLVLGLGWVVYSNWGRLFPNAAMDSLPTAPATPQQSPLERARSLHAEGQTAIAIAQLKRLPPDHPDYQQAQALVSEWEATTPTPEAVPSLPPEEQEKLDRLLAAAREASSRRRYLDAIELFERAQLITPLEGTDAQRYSDAQREVIPLASIIADMKDNEYELALPKLWQIRVDDPSNEDARELIVTSYFNLGVRNLNRGALDKAREMFSEARELAPEDEELRRLQLFAQTYQERGEDLLLRIYVKYLPYRSV